MSHLTYLDESGDLGFKFDLPYRKGGSSRHLTIAFFICPKDKKDYLKRVVRKIYQKYKFPPGNEVKGSSFTLEQKVYVAQRIVDLLNKHPEITINAITVKKENVKEHIRKDPNLLYNFMLRRSLLDKIDTFESVLLIRDSRSIKVKSGNSLIDYLKMMLLFEYNTGTELTDCPLDSSTSHNLILADWLNNIIFAHYEDGNSEAFRELNGKLTNMNLFF